MDKDLSLLLNRISTGIVRWISFDKKASILILDCGEDDYMYSPRVAVEEWLSEEGYNVNRYSPDMAVEAQPDSGRKYDVILVLGALETSGSPKEILTIAGNMLNQNGRLLLACGNPFGLRYFCGDHDPFTGKIFDGIDGYMGVNAESGKYLSGRLYSDSEIRTFLAASGWKIRKRFSVFPDISCPQLIYADGVVPNESLASRLFPYYEHPESAWLSEHLLVDRIIEGGMFHQMADGYLYECAAADNTAEAPYADISKVSSVTLSLDRGTEHASATIIQGKEKVVKRMFFEEGTDNLKALYTNLENLKQRGIRTVNARLEGNALVMPYQALEPGMEFFSRMIDEGKEAFLAALDRFVDQIRQSSDPVKDEEGKDVLEHGYIDMVPLNAFVDDGDFIFFDQEFDLPMCPAEVIITRTLLILGGLGARFNDLIPAEELYARYNIPLYGGKYGKQARRWHDELKNRKLLGDYRRSHSDDPITVAANRNKANFSLLEYERNYTNIFRDWDKVDFYVFGTGRFARRFMSIYADRYQIKAMVDNDVSKQGKTISGCAVNSPDELPVSEKTRVIICVKQYMPIQKQLESLGITDVCIYDPSAEIRDPKLEEELGKRNTAASLDKGSEEAGTAPHSKYRTGYVSGVFDLFHVGHLNLLERAKAMCDYLIVEVTSDEAVRRDKNVEPTIPLEDRMRIVAGLKCVDEVHPIPMEAPTSADAWKRYHFDVQFRGSDYSDNDSSKNEREFLKKHGAELVIFPYTESVSSTKLRKELRSLERRSSE